MRKPEKPLNRRPGPEMSDEDVLAAMSEIPGYLDITPGDFRELYRHAWRRALDRITRSVRAKDVMSAKVWTVGPDAPLREVAALMARRGVAGVPVVDGDGMVLGIVSEKDFLARMTTGGTGSFMGLVAECVEGRGCVAGPLRSRRAADIMTSPAITVGEETTVEEIAELLDGRGINRVPVVSADGRLRGIVSRGDVVGAVRAGK